MVFHKGVAQEFGEEHGHSDPLPGQFNGWLEQLGPRQPPVLSVNCLVAPQLSGNADPLRPWVKQKMETDDKNPHGSDRGAIQQVWAAGA